MTDEVIEQSDRGFDTETEDFNEQTEVEETSEDVTDETDDEGSENDEELDVEIEYEGKNYRIPPELKDAILRHQDYTKKTQEVSETKQAIEQERAAFEQERQLAAQSYQRQQATLEARVNKAALDNQIAQYEQVDWSAYTDQDPAEAQKQFMKYNQLREQSGKLGQYISQQEQQFQFENQKTLAEKIEKGRAQLQKEIPNWSPKMAEDIAKTAKQIGMSNEDINSLVEPAHVMALYYAKIGYEAVQKAKAKPKAEVQPVKSVKSSNSGNAKDPEKMSVDEWTKWREKQLRKQA